MMKGRVEVLVFMLSVAFVVVAIDFGFFPVLCVVRETTYHTSSGASCLEFQLVLQCENPFCSASQNV